MRSWWGVEPDAKMPGAQAVFLTACGTYSLACSAPLPNRTALSHQTTGGAIRQANCGLIDGAIKALQEALFLPKK